MACSLSSRICSTLASIASSALTAAVLTASAACVAAVLADSKRSAFSAAGDLSAGLMVVSSSGGLAVVHGDREGRGGTMAVGPAGHGSRVRARTSLPLSYTDPRDCGTSGGAYHRVFARRWVL